MPIKTARSSDADSADVQVREGVDILSPDGELSLAAKLASDFLADADFGAVMNHESVEDQLVFDPDLVESDDEDEDDKGGDKDKKSEKKDDKKKDGEEDDEEMDESGQPGFAFLAGGVAASVIDAHDLAECFAHYLDNRPRSTLSEKAALAHFQDMLGIEELEEGCFDDAVQASKANRDKLAEMLLAMISESDVVMTGTGDSHDFKNQDPVEAIGKIRTAAQKAKAARIKKKPKTAQRKKELKMAARKRKRQIGKFHRLEKKRAVRFARRHGEAETSMESVARWLRETADSELTTGRPLIGFGCVVEGTIYEVGVLEDVSESVVESRIAEAGDYGGKMCSNKKTVKKQESKADDGEDSKQDDAGKKTTTESAHQPRRGASMLHEDSYKAPEVGALSSGASIAARMPMLSSAAPKKTEVGKK